MCLVFFLKTNCYYVEQFEICSRKNGIDVIVQQSDPGIGVIYLREAVTCWLISL